MTRIITAFRDKRKTWKSENGSRIIPRQDSVVRAGNRCCQQSILVVLSIAILQCVISWCAISKGVSAFSAAAKSNGRHKYDASSIREAREKFDAWATVNPAIIQEFIVREEDILNAYSSSSDNTSAYPQGLRVTRFAARVFSETLPTPNSAKLACRRGSLTLNNTEVSGGRIVREGDVLALTDQCDRRTSVPSDPIRADIFCEKRLRLVDTMGDGSKGHSPLRVLYEDRNMAIVCKPAGIHTMSWSGSFGKCLCLDEILPLVLTPPEATSSGDESGLGECLDDEGLPAPLPRHRLDRRVAGPVVVAKTRKASVEIGRSFEEKRVTKEYRAIVVGKVDENTIKGVTGISNIKSQSSNLSFTICSDVDGRPSETDVEVLTRTPCNVNGFLTDLKLFPKTGRQHQLRIHCAKVLGTPILGDDLYWNESRQPENVMVRRGQGLYLYCKRVSIDHPLIGGDKVVSAEIDAPLRFIRTLKKARKGFEWTRAHAKTIGDNDQQE